MGSYYIDSNALSSAGFSIDQIIHNARGSGGDFVNAFNNLMKIAVQKAYAIQQSALRYTAADVRRTAQRSIKSGGKSPSSKNYSFSKPGEAPKYHRSTLKQGIQYEKVDDGTYLIGPERVGVGSTLKTLEYGGKGSFTETVYTDDYAKTRKQTKRRQKDIYSRSYRCSVHGTVRASRPQASHPYRVYTKGNPRGQVVRDYLYFYSYEEWEAASNSPRFQQWATTKRMTTRQEVDVAARPFMRPALAVETAAGKVQSRMTRAIRASK